MATAIWLQSRDSVSCYAGCGWFSARIRARFRFAADRRRDSTSLPAISHAAIRSACRLVRVTVDGETYYLNDTDQYSVWAIHFSRWQNSASLSPRVQMLETLHAAMRDWCRDRTGDHLRHLTLSDDGKARITIGNDYYGMAILTKNTSSSPNRSPEERNRYFHQKVVSAVAQGARAGR